MSEKQSNFEGMEMVEQKPEIEIVPLADGFGYGDGSISYVARKEAVGSEVLAKAEEAIASEDILEPVSKDKHGNYIQDDGCGDGRGVRRVFKNGIEKLKSLARAKVFGGGVTMVTAMEIGDGQAAGKTLNEVFSASITLMEDKGIDFGGHTDDHAEGENCGCGAIDKSPTVVSNVARYRDSIKDSINALGVDTTGLDQVLDNYETYNYEIVGQSFSGKAVSNQTSSTGKVVKQLADDHREAFVLLNTVEGYTVNQQLVRDLTDNQVQVFAVDVWRLQELAVLRHPGDQAKQNQAFLSELVYTLGVSATLTQGDLPVRVLRRKDYALVA